MKSKWSHSGMIFEQTPKAIFTVETSKFEVVHANALTDYIDNANVSIEVWRFNELTDEDRESISDTAAKLRGITYGYGQLFSLGIRRILMRFGIKIDNFINWGLVCCHVITHGYSKSPIKSLSAKDPEALDTQELYELVSASAELVYKKD